MFTSSKLTVGLILSLSFSAPLYARPGHGGMSPEQFADMIRQYDTNQDGKLSQTELQAARGVEFKQADTSADGTLDIGELQAQMDSQRAKKLTDRYTSLDTDSNGQLSLEEFQSDSPLGSISASGNLFTLLDKDQSSGLSQEELATLETEEGHLLRHFTHLDSDGDGKVSETEYSTVIPLGHHAGGGFGGR